MTLPLYKPMLAGTVQDERRLRYPVLASPKLDGIRCLTSGDGPRTRALKQIPNDALTYALEELAMKLQGCLLDGELRAGSTYQQTVSAVMRRQGTYRTRYAVFDLVSDEGYTEPFYKRYKRLRARAGELARALAHTHVSLRVLPHRVIRSVDELLAYEARCLERGYEGVMLRSPAGPYKHGRSTWREGWLLKLKRFVDGEAEVIGVEPLYTNTNEAFVGELGQTRRSSAKDGKVMMPLLGALTVRDLATGAVFNLGTGFTREQRLRWWGEDLTGLIVKYKSLPHGVVDLPRHPVFLGFRDERDM